MSLFSLGQWLGWTSPPEEAPPTPVAIPLPRFIEPTPHAMNTSVESEDDFARLTQTFSKLGRTQFNRELFSLFCFGVGKDDNAITPLAQRLRGTRQDAADYLLKRTVEINRIAQEALRNVLTYERTHGDSQASRTCKIALDMYTYHLAIPRLASTLTPRKENGGTDTSYIARRYAHIPEGERTIPHIYGIQLDALKASTHTLPPTGLVNRGANCWAIAVLQLLINVPHFYYHIVRNLPPNLAPMRELIAQYLLDEGQKAPVSRMDANGLRELLHREMGIVGPRVHENADAVEAFSMIAGSIPGFHIPPGERFDPTRHRRSNLFHFVIQHKKRYNFPDEGIRPADYSPDGSRTIWEERGKIDASIPNRLSIQLEEILAKVYDNPYSPVTDDPTRFGDISLHPQEETIRYQIPPMQLTIGFNRFRYNIERRARLKIQTKIDVPLHYTLPSNISLDGRAASYHLQGVIIHTGGTEHGHYYACIRKGTTWFLCDDQRVQPISEERAKEIARNAYLVTYEREGFIDREEAERRSRDRMGTRVPVEALVTHDSLPLDHRSDMLIGITEQFLNNPTVENFERFPHSVQQQLAFIKWVADGRPDQLEYGMYAIRRDPASLLAIATPYYSFHGENIIKQLWYRNVYLNQSSVKAVHEDPDLYREWLTRTDEEGRPLFSDAHLRFLQNILTIRTKNQFAYETWCALGQPTEDRIGEKQFKESPRLLLRRSPQGSTYLEQARAKLIHP